MPILVCHHRQSKQRGAIPRREACGASSLLLAKGVALDEPLSPDRESPSVHIAQRFHLPIERSLERHRWHTVLTAEESCSLPADPAHLPTYCLRDTVATPVKP